MKRILLVFVLALILRVMLINRAPIGFNPDEASFGYDAYSILKTGRDQWGNKFPLVLKSFGDHKAPLYSYITAPVVAIFGLNPFAVRLPNAICGSLAVVAFYLMINQMFEYEKNRTEWFKVNFEKKKNFVALVASLLFTISPWHISMSRGAFEANLTTLFLPLGIYLFYKFLNGGKNYNLYLSVVTFGLNLFTYHSAKLITLLVLIALAAIHFNEIKKNYRAAVASSLILLLFGLVTFYTFMNGAGSRLADVSIFKLSLSSASSERIRAFNNGLPDVVSRVFHNKYQVFLKTASSNYLSYFSPQFLFVRGAGERTYGMNDDRGVLYWFELPLLLFFVKWVLKNKIGRSIYLVFFWFLISPIPASLAIGPGFAANRAVIMLPSIYLFLSLGAYELSNLSFSSKFRIYTKIFGKIYILLSIVFFVSFLENYFYVTPSKIAKDMLYGNLEAAQFLRGSSRQIVVSRKLSEPHIYVAFANKIDPATYQENTIAWNFEESGLGWVDQMGEYKLGNYLFKNIYYPEWKDKNVILVGRPDEFPESIIPAKKFADPSGNELIYIVDTQSSYYAEGNKK